ncbi:MAG: BatA domain-containing protein [Planctomycetota bacterium]
MSARYFQAPRQGVDGVFSQAKEDDVSFVQWIFLLGGLAVAGPVFAHLLAKPRFRRLPFTMLRFLYDGQIESRSRRKLRDLLILLLRCAIIVLIAMLFARPMLHIKRKPQQTRAVYCLGLDNSMSMAYTDGADSHFDKLRISAIDYIRSAKTDAIFNICAMASGDWLNSLSKEQALAEVKALKIESGSADVGDFISSLDRVKRTEHLDDEVSVLVLSDFTPKTLKRFVETEKPAVVDKMDYKLIISPEPVSNAAIIDAHVIGIIDGKLTANVTVANYGRVEQHRRLTARTGENKSAPVDINLFAQQRRTSQIQVKVDTAGEEQFFMPVELSLSNGDGLKEDDTFYMSVSSPGRKNVNVLLAGNGADEMFLLKTAMETISRKSSYDTLQIRQILIDDFALSDLKWADVVICSEVGEQLAYFASNIGGFIKAGGRFICFVKEVVESQAARQLWQREVLAALPGKCIHERTYMQPNPCDSRAFGVDNIAARSLSNYRIDKILLKGYLQCQQHPDSKCLWRFRNGLGCIYLKRLGVGVSILVNTSVDDSLGSLTKSNASVAFCQYLLGRDNQIGEYCFARDEQVMLPLSERQGSFAGQKQFWVQTCDGRKRRAAAADSFLLVPDPAGTGWVKTLGKPTMWAGINLPEGETDMTKPTASELADIMKRIFPTGTERSVSAAEALNNRKRTPIWKYFAWVIILLLLAEPAVANRLKR